MRAQGIEIPHVWLKSTHLPGRSRVEPSETPVYTPSSALLHQHSANEQIEPPKRYEVNAQISHHTTVKNHSLSSVVWIPVRNTPCVILTDVTATAVSHIVVSLSLRLIRKSVLWCCNRVVSIHQKWCRPPNDSDNHHYRELIIIDKMIIAHRFCLHREQPVSSLVFIPVIASSKSIS